MLLNTMLAISRCAKQSTFTILHCQLHPPNGVLASVSDDCSGLSFILSTTSVYTTSPRLLSLFFASVRLTFQVAIPNLACHSQPGQSVQNLMGISNPEINQTTQSFNPNANGCFTKLLVVGPTRMSGTQACAWRCQFTSKKCAKMPWCSISAFTLLAFSRMFALPPVHHAIFLF